MLLLLLFYHLYLILFLNELMNYPYTYVYTDLCVYSLH